MDIASLSTELSTMSICTQASTAVMKLSLNQMDTNADGLKKIMENSVSPYLGNNIDISI